MATIIERIVGQSALPGGESLGYQRPKSVFGGYWHETRDHRLVWTQNIVSHADRFGDDVLRRTDEHTVALRRVLARNWRNAGAVHNEFWPLLTTPTKRSRGTSEEIMENVEALTWMEGQERHTLSEFYGLYTVNGNPKGIEALQPDIIRNSITLEDILLGLPKDRVKDRFQAYRLAGEHIRNVHQTSGRGIGEILANDILFRKVEEGIVAEPLLNIPDIIYRARPKVIKVNDNGRTYYSNPSLSDAVAENTVAVKPTVKDQHATDMLDFMMDIAVWECRRAEKAGEQEVSPYAIQEAMRHIVEGYLQGDTTGEAEKVIHAVRSFAIRGRLSLRGDEDIIDDAKEEMGRRVVDKININREENGLDPISYSHNPYRRTHILTATHNEARLGISQLKRKNRITAARLARQGVIDASAI